MDRFAMTAHYRRGSGGGVNLPRFVSNGRVYTLTGSTHVGIVATVELSCAFDISA